MPEPILKKVLKKENRIVKFKRIELLVPSPKAMVEMKLKSSPQRTDSFKRTKDISDLTHSLKTTKSCGRQKTGQEPKQKA